MRIAIVGSVKRIEELKEKVSSTHELIEVKNNQFEGYDLIFDLSFDKDNNSLKKYQAVGSTPVVLCAVNQTIEEIVSQQNETIGCPLFGMNTLPTFINRELAEMTALNEGDRGIAEKVFTALDWPIKWVESRVGMVTPRIVCMIINEAYYTVQEGTASKEDINVGMKLGTAYPKGPFEWAEEMGIATVYHMLEAIYNDTKDERYKVCPLLKKEHLQSQLALQN